MVRKNEVKSQKDNGGKRMKKIIALALSAVMMVAMVACGSEEQPEASYKAGVGINTTVSKRMDATADSEGEVEITTTMMAASFDPEGKVVSATLDIAQQGVKFDNTGKFTSEPILLTKAERGDDYGLVAFAGSEHEMYEQFAALEDWMVGKTVEEIVGMELTAKGSPAAEDLSASVTVSVSSYLEALQKAWDTATETTGPVATTGLGTLISATKTDAGENDGKIEITTNIAAASFDAEGKVVWANIDVAQQSATVSAEGKITNEIDTRTKIEKGDEYGLVAYAGSEHEMYEQLASLSEWMLGKTSEEIMGMELTETTATAEEDLKASVTVKVGGYLEAFEKAAANAK